MNLNINFQRVIWLATGPTTHRDQIIQPQQCWQRTLSEHSVGMMLLQIYHLSTGSDLIIEGSKTRDAWNEIRRHLERGREVCGHWAVVELSPLRWQRPPLGLHPVALGPLARQ